MIDDHHQMITIAGQVYAMASVLKREKAESPVPTGSFRVPKKKIPCFAVDQGICAQRIGIAA
jgi:hypothetical protein